MHGKASKWMVDNIFYVFNLKGEPLCKYVLDHCIYGISVNEQKGTILATDVNKDEPIIEYTMK